MLYQDSFGYIYKTTNLVNNMIYVGQKKGLIEKTRSYLGSGKYLKRAVNKYGRENFKKEIIRECNSKEELHEFEIFYIKMYRDFGYEMYNISSGGEYGDTFTNNPNKEEIRQKKKGRIPWNKNKKMSDDFCRKDSESCKGRIPWNKNKKDIYSKEYIDKLKKFTKNNIHINNGKEQKFVQSELVSEFLKNGYKLGRLYKKRNKPSTLKDKIYVNNTIKNEIILEEQLEEFLNNGYNIGKKKGKKQKNIKCQNCEREISSSNFKRHYEKCIMKKRNFNYIDYESNS